MNSLVILAVLVIGTYGQLNQVADYEGNLFDCEFVASSTSCCMFKRFDAGEDFAMCMGGSAWNQVNCTCSDADLVDNCDPAVDCASGVYQEKVDAICKDAAALASSGGCCQNNRVYYPVDGVSSNYTFNGEELACHPVMDFNVSECACVGLALMDMYFP
ncbi:unnamed protein product [Owenia fusiformis]|uniref:Uncharacterized protein n=1 Tax=Owenia fusiformis TaxID=6347 RepID=A0A8J1TXY6_OWEFU|nr:unnamed protein product [Owenia fusiformis]